MQQFSQFTYRFIIKNLLSHYNICQTKISLKIINQFAFMAQNFFSSNIILFSVYKLAHLARFSKNNKPFHRLRQSLCKNDTSSGVFPSIERKNEAVTERSIHRSVYCSFLQVLSCSLVSFRGSSLSAWPKDCQHSTYFFKWSWLSPKLQYVDPFLLPRKIARAKEASACSYLSRLYSLKPFHSYSSEDLYSLSPIVFRARLQSSISQRMAASQVIVSSLFYIDSMIAGTLSVLLLLQQALIKPYLQLRIEPEHFSKWETAKLNFSLSSSSIPKLKVAIMQSGFTFKDFLQQFSAISRDLLFLLFLKELQCACPKAFKASAEAKLMMLFSQYLMAWSISPNFSQQSPILQLLKLKPLDLQILWNSALAFSNSGMAFLNWMWCMRRLPLRWQRQGWTLLLLLMAFSTYSRASQYLYCLSRARTIKRCSNTSSLLYLFCFRQKLRWFRLFSGSFRQKYRIAFYNSSSCDNSSGFAQIAARSGEISARLEASLAL